MKKLMMILMVAGLYPGYSQAQFVGGFFSQQSTQRKLMAEQIAGWQVYLGALKTGYHITETGLNSAHDLKNGTYGLHTAYFNSLEQINPAVQNNPKGKAIVAISQQIAQTFTNEISWQQKEKQLTANEMTYLQKVADNLLNACKTDLSELNDVLSPGKLQLTDQQRLDRLDKLYAAMQDKQAFAGSFTAKCRRLALARKQDKANRDQIKKLYGIAP